MPDGKAEQEEVGSEDEEKSDHGRNAARVFNQEVVKLWISPDPGTGITPSQG